MDARVLILTFSETVNISTFDPTEITLQNMMSLDLNDSEYYTLTGGYLLSRIDGPVVTLMLDTYDANNIKAIRTLAKQQSDTFISITSLIVQDMEQYYAVNISNSSSLPILPRNYIPDMTGPVLMEFDLDADTGVLTLEFDETVDADTLRIRRLFLRSDDLNTTANYSEYQLRGPYQTTTVSPIVQFELSPANILAVKTLPHLATNPNNTFLLLREDTVQDTALIPNGAMMALLQVRNYTYDQTGPSILSFAVDLTAGTVTLNFDEPVLASSLNTTGFTAIAGPNSTSFYTLTGGYTDSTDNFQIVLILSNDDFNIIKQMEDLWTEVNNTYISVEPHFITDPTVLTSESEPNPVMEITVEEPLQAFLVINDTGMAILDSFELDLNTGILILHFSETINITTFNFSGITLQEVSDTGLMPLANSYTLTNGTFISMGDVPDVIIRLDRDDLNAIKALEIANSARTSYLIIEADTVRDQMDNPNAPRIDGINALRVAMYISDMSSPQLERFDLNLTSDTLTLHFDETVRVSTLDVTEISLHDNDTIRYFLTNGSYSDSPNGPSVVIFLSEFDRNNIKRELGLATDTNNTYISLSQLTVEDMAIMSNMVDPVDDLQVDIFTEDLARPELNGFDLDLTGETLTLYFSETVDVATFDVTGITFLNLETGENHTLTNGSIRHGNEPIVIVDLRRFDLNIIKQLITLATDENNTMLFISNQTIRDMNGNVVLGIDPNEALSVRNFTADMLSPILESFDLNMDDSTITLYFSETVNTISLMPTAITLQDSIMIGTSYQLTGGYTETDNNSVVVVNITKMDLDLIKFDFLLATSRVNTYISFPSNLVVDMFGNEVVEISNSSAQQVDRFFADITPPFLESFNLDMDTGVITLTFSETVNSDSFDQSALTLQLDTMVDATDSFLFYSPVDRGNWSMVNSTVIELTFAIEDLNQIKFRYLLATKENNTFITFSGQLIRDMNGVNVVAITNGNAQQVTNFTEDTTRPELVSWVMDLDVGAMILTYDETVNRNSLMVTEFILQDNTPAMLDMQELTGGLSVSPNGTVITVIFAINDLNEIKRKSICTDVLGREDCYLTYSNISIEDMNGNLVIDRDTNSSQQADGYVADDTQPVLVEFILFDLTNETFTIRFDETVNVSTFATVEIVLKSFFTDPNAGSLRLTGPDTLITDEDSTVVSFKPTTFDLNRIKQNTILCTDVTPPNCYIGISSNLVLDMAMNPVAAVNETTGRASDLYATVVGDMIAPRLVNFSIHLDSNNITLTFDETINVETFNPTGITFQNHPNASEATESYTLTGGTRLSMEDWLYLHFELAFVDSIALRYMEELATDLNDTYISVSSITIQDMNDNSVAPIPEEDALQAWDYEADVTSPELLDFRFDLQNDLLYLTFDEPVRINSTIFTNITLQGGSNSSLSDVPSFTLTGGQAEYGFVNKSILIITVTAADMRSIKLTDRLASTQVPRSPGDRAPIDTYISLAEGTVLDTAGNPLIEILPDEAREILQLIRDSLEPRILFYDIDLDEGTLTIFYDDVVDQTTLTTFELTIHNQSNPTTSNKFTLTGGFTETDDDYFTVLQFSEDDLNEIKRNEGVAVNENKTFITHTEFFISDERGLNILPIPGRFVIPGQEEAFQVRRFTEDTNPPSLVRYTLDMNIGVLFLTFNETVKANTFNRTQITLQNVMNTTLLEITQLVPVVMENDTMDNNTAGSGANGTEMYTEVVVGYEYDPSILHFTLTGGSHAEAIDATTINVTFSKEDFDEIKRIFGLAISRNTTFITIPDTILLDMNRNSIVPIPTTEAQRAAVFIEDSTRPYLISWDLDMDGGNMTLYFPETMDASTFDVTQLRIQSKMNSTIGHTLTGGSRSMDDALVIYVWITRVDLDEIKRILEIATSRNNSFLSFTPGLVSDMNANPIIDRNTSFAIQVDMFSEDISPPQLVSFDLDMDSDLLTLTFSETVDASSINYTSITLISAPNSTDEFGVYTLTGGNSSTGDSFIIDLIFSKEDSDEIRRLYNLATSSLTTYLVLDQGGIQDVVNNEVVGIGASDPINVTVFTPDTTDPTLVSFDLDFDTSQLFLTFSETVDTTTFVVQEITLVSHNNASHPAFTSFSLTGGNSSLENSTFITVNLTLDDTNEIKRLVELAITNETTFISFTSDLIDDMNANNVIAQLCSTETSYCDALPVTIYIEDITPPELLAFDLNLTSEVLTLFFSETVNTSSLDVSQITLQYAENVTGGERVFVFSPLSSFTNTSNNDIVEIVIGLDDLNELKRIRGLAVDPFTSYISMTAQTVLDMNNNMLSEIQSSDALQVSVFTDDTINPVLLGYELDLNAGTLLLNFSETIDIFSFNISTITFQADEFVPDSNYTYTLNMGSGPILSSTPSSDSHTIIINIGSEDLNAIKRIVELAQNRNTTDLQFPPSFVRDMSGNDIVPRPNGMALQVDTYYEDIVGPILLSYTLNLTSELLILTFDETVDISSLNISFLILQSEQPPIEGSGSGSGVQIVSGMRISAGSGSGSGSGMDQDMQTNMFIITTYTLTSFESITEIDGPIVTIQLTDMDLHEIKLRRDLASNPNNTFLTIRLGAFYDNALSANPSMELTQAVDVYGFDITSPQLTEFAVDVNAGTINLNFDEPVDISTFDPTGLVLQAGEVFTHMQQQLRLTGGFSPSTDGLSILVRLTEDDLNELKRSDMLYTSIDTAYLRIDEFFIRDMAGNPIAVIEDGNARQAAVFRNDTIMPVLESYSLDMDSGQLVLTFSETVNVSSLQLSDLTLQRFSNVTFERYSYSLTGGNLLVDIDNTTVHVQITNDDLNEIKARTIANEASTTWLVFPSTLISDMNMQPVEERVNGLNAAAVDNYTPDTTSPQLLSFSLNLTSGEIALSFTETVNVEDTLNLLELTLQNSVRINRDVDGFNFYTLTSASESLDVNGPEFSIVLSIYDLNAIKQRPELGTIINNTFISYSPRFISDMVGNMVVNIPSTRGTQAVQVAPDKIRPQLSFFDFDLNTEIITFYFSETVDLSTFDLTEFTLVDGPSPSGVASSSYRLTGGSMRSLDSSVIQVTLNTPDVNNVKRIFTLATDANDTYISITRAVLTDMSGLLVIPIPIEEALQVRFFVEDVIRPRLAAYSLDLDGTGQLILTFDETVNSESLDVTQIHLQDNTTASVRYQLVSSYTLSTNTTAIVIELSAEDLNNIKRITSLAISSFNTFLTLTDMTIVDMNDNQVMPITDMSAVGVRSFTPDRTRPHLVAFSIDITNGNLTLSFSETVRASTFSPSELTIQAGLFAGSLDRYTLTGGSWKLIDSTEIELQLSFEDLNTLKQLEQVATMPGNTFIVHTFNLIDDMNGNDVIGIDDGQALQVREGGFTADLVAPELISFVVDLDRGVLLLNFTEAVNITTLRPTDIIIQDCCYDCDLVSSGIGSGELTDSSSGQQNTVPSVSGSGLQPVGSGSGMVIIPTSSGGGSSGGSGSGLVMSGMPMAPVCNTPVYSYALTGGDCVDVLRTTFTCTLTARDLNEIKRLPLCFFNNSGQDCCLSLAGDPLMDQNNNPIDPTTFEGCGFSSTDYIVDTNAPDLIEFTLFNLDTRTITLTFNETINADTVDVTKITLQSFYRNPQMSYTLTGGTVIPQDSTNVTILLTDEDWFEIQRQRGLCSDINNCWISLSEGFAQDTAENVAIVVPPTNARDAAMFVDDVGRPSLLAFELNLNNNTATLTFSETVSASTLDASAITFLNARANNATMIQLTGGSTSSSDGLVIVVNLLPVDTNRIRALDDIGTSHFNTYISITENLIADAVRRNPNQVNAIEPTSALPITPGTLVPDGVPPMVLSFSINLVRDIVTLTFNEPVRVSSMRYTGVTLLSEPSYLPVDLRNLTGGENTEETNLNGTMILSGYLVQPDIRYLKLSNDLATSVEDTWLSIEQGTIQDMEGNDLVAIPLNVAIRATDFVDDDTPAMLIDFTLDMDLGLLHLTFSDIINASTFYPRALTIQNSRVIGTDFVTLSLSSLTESENGYFITVNISTEDLNRVKLNDNLATMLGNTYVSLRGEGFDDNYGRNVIPTTTHEAILASNFTEDQTAPFLVDFELDMNLGALILTFDETVRANTIIEGEIILLNTFNISQAGESYIQLTGGVASTQDSTVITVYITTNDLNVIKVFQDFGTNENNTYIAFSSRLIMDMNGNQVDSIESDSAKKALRFYEDLTSPQLVSFSIDLTLEEIVLTFDETVNATSVAIPEFAVQGDEMQMDFRQLSDSTHSFDDSTFVTIFLGLNDLNEIKRLTSVATSTNDTFITATDLAIRDMNGNALTPIPSTRALQASNFSGDVIRPELRSFSLNLSSEILTLSFSETVRASTHDISLYTFLSNSSDAESLQTHALTGGFSQPNDYHIINVELSVADLNVIKRLIYLATSENNTYLAVGAGAVYDMSGNGLVPVELGLAIPVDVFAEDLVPPVLQRFNLDMNTGVLTLLFSETVESDSFDVTQISLQDSSNSSAISHTLSNSSFTDSNDSSIIIVQVAPVDLNEIKREFTLAIDGSSTYITITSLVVDDMNENPAVEIAGEDALGVAVFVADRNPPQLEEFDLNLNNSELVLRFNETVNRESLNVESITIQHAEESSGPLFTLQLTQESSSSISPNDTYIVVDIGLFDLNSLKRLTEIATSRNNTHLSINSSAIDDMNNNAVVQIPTNDAIQVTTFIQDAIRPVLQSFSLDVNSGVLVLSFSETVNATSLNISAISLQSQDMFISNESYTLFDGVPPLYSSSNSTNDPIITVYIGSTDLNAIKAIYELANFPNSTYISITEETITDMVGLPVEPIYSNESLSAETFIEDTTGPVLLSFTLDLTSERLILTFDETVNVDSFNITHIILQSDGNFSEATYHVLRDYRSILMENSTMISVLLALDDLHEIKLNTDLATSEDNTYIQISPAAVHDMAVETNSVQEDTVPVGEYMEDLVSPTLVSFSIDMNLGLLVLNFDEPVNASSIDYTAFTLYSDQVPVEIEASGNDSLINGTAMDFNNITASGSGSGGVTVMAAVPITSYTLTDGSTNSSNGLQITVIITDNDLNAIKRDELLFTSRFTSFITITPAAIEDMNRNQAAEITPFEAVQASAYTNDTTPPIVLSFDLDMDMGVIVLSFPETVDVSTTMFDGIILQRAPNVSLEMNQYMLMRGMLTILEDGLVASIQITLDDLNELKRRRIALSPNTTWLVLDEAAILDMSDQGVVGIFNGINAQIVSNYTPDTTPPILSAFDVDLTREVLTLSFSETVDVSQFNVTSITLQDTVEGNNTFSHYTLTNSSYLNSPSSHVIEVVLGLDDLNEIKKLTELAVDENSTFIRLTSDLLQDVFGNDIVEIDQSLAQQVSRFTPDTIDPTLDAFDLDLDARILTLYFSETVNSSSLNVSGIRLAGGDQATTQTYQLTSSFTDSSDGPVIEVQLTRDDFNDIKVLTELATDENNTFLILETFAVTDMSGNMVVNISAESPLRVQTYVKDISSPSLEYFDLDMNNLTLTLEFSESVNVSSINYSAITIIESDSPYLLSYTLISGDTESPNGPRVVIEILKEDEDNLKRIDGLATNENNTYLIISSDLVVDMDGNPILNITADMPLVVRTFIEDATPPVLLYFDLDLTLDLLTFVFSETVNVSSLDITGITLQSKETLDENSTTYYTLTDSRVENESDDPIVVIGLSRFDRDEIRRLSELAFDANSTYLNLVAGSILDMVSIPVTAVLNDSAQLVRNFTEDMVSPELEAYSLDLTEEILALNFSETVNITTFDVTQLTLHNTNSSMFSLTYSLTGGTIQNRDHSPYIVLSLSTPDLNVIKFETDLAVSIDTTFLSLPEALVEDMNFNPVIPILSPVQADQFTSDMIPPRLLEFELDLNNETLTLIFSETVNVDTLSVMDIQLQSTANATSSFDPVFTFTDESFSTSINGTVVVVRIGLNDLNLLKQLAHLAINNDTTFLSLSRNAISDMNSNPVEEISPDIARQVSVYTPDTTSPSLIDFSIDLDAETLLLFFSETVNVSSFDVQGISLQSTSNSNDVSVSLTNFANISTENGPTILVYFSQDDLNLLKSVTNLATSINDTFITVTAAVVSDMFSNPLNTIQSAAALQAGEVSSDFTQPRLLMFDFDADSGMITFYFSESINSTSLDPTELTVVASNSSVSSNYTLTAYSEITTRESETIVVLTLTAFDLNSIKAITTLGTGSGNTFISITPDFVRDQFMNNITAIEPEEALPVTNYTEDTTCPFLDEFTFDLDSGVLSLTFIEPVNTSSFDPTMITMVNEDETVAYQLRYQGEFDRTLFTRFVPLTLSDFDFDRIKATTTLGVEISNTFLLLSEFALQDSAGNSYCNDTTPTQATEVIPDTTPPVLLNFTLDLDQEIIIFTFTETVTLPLRVGEITLLEEPDLSTLPEMTFVSGSGDLSTNFTDIGTNISSSGSGMDGGGSGMDLTSPPVVQYTLTGGMSFINYTTEPHIVILQLTQDDLNRIKNQSELAVSQMTTQISITSDLTNDYSMNAVTPIPPYSPLEVADFLPDVTPPTIQAFSLNMDLRILTLTFSEVVNLTFFDPSGLTLQSGPVIDRADFYMLQSSTANFETLTEVNILLSDEDANEIKRMTTLAADATNTYISVTPELVQDTSNLDVVAISNTSAIPVRIDGYTRDTTPPYLVEFSFNLTSELLILTFDETVDVSTVRPDMIIFQSDEFGSNMVPLSGGDVSSDDSTVVSITLTDVDLHNIKRNLDLATRLNNTCITVLGMALSDLSFPTANRFREATQCATVFIPDLVEPRLNSFVVNLNSGILILNFDEPVDIDTINATSLTLQADSVAGPRVEEVTLTGGEVSSPNQLRVIFNITLEDLNVIKQRLFLLRDIDSSFLRIHPTFVFDLNSNSVVEILASDALQASMFIDDVTAPVLEEFDLDMNLGHLTLYFSETVDVSTLDFTGLSLQLESEVLLSNESHTLTNDGTVLSSDAPVVVLRLSNDDLNVLKTIGIGRTNDTVYITLTNETVLDITGQAVIPIENGINSFPVQGYSPDITPPMLVDFSIDLTAETLTLSFNETVDTRTLNVTYITLTASRNVTDDEVSYTLTDTSFSLSRNLPEIVIQLSRLDLNEIKRRELATFELDTFIYLSNLAIDDTFGNPVVDILPEEAIMVMTYAEDTIDPFLVDFDLDMNTGTLTMSFTETVNTASLDTSGITFYSEMNPGTASQTFTLSGDFAFVSNHSDVIDVILTNDDLNELKVRQMLATERSNTFLRITRDTILDMNFNRVRDPMVSQVVNFTADETPPLLMSFTIDMDTGELTLNFDETINSSSLRFDHLALINNETFVPTPADPDDQHQLRGGVVITPNGPSLALAFTEEDLNEIKRQDMCTRALQELDCFLVYRTNAILDMNMNGIEGCRQVDT